MPIFNADIDNYTTLIESVKKNKMYLSSSFEFKSNYGSATGTVASREVFNRIFGEIFQILFKPVNNFYCDIDENNDFWERDENIYALGNIISCACYKYHCVLPYHFSPGFLEILCGIELTPDELLKYVKIIDSELYDRTIDIIDDDFVNVDSDYETKEELYVDIIKKFSNITDLKKNIIGKMKSSLSLSLSSSLSSAHPVYDQDVRFSGNYEISPEIMKRSLKFLNKDLLDKWNIFLDSLSNDELKRMMLLFKNTLSTRDIVGIYAKEMDRDIKIEVCFYRVTIKKSLFNDMDTLNNLRLYFCEGVDNILD